MAQWWSVILAGLFFVTWQLETWIGDPGGSRRWIALLGACATLSLAAAQWWPLQAAAASLSALVIGSFFQARFVFDADTTLFVAIAAVCIFGAQPRWRERLAGLAAILPGTFLAVANYPAAAAEAHGVTRLGIGIGNAATFSVAWAIAVSISNRVRTTRSLRQRTVDLEAERDLMAAQAVADERARIARELHDVVAHNVSVMVLQAGGVRRLLSGDQRREREALATIEETGRRALAEMRRMVGVMRADADGGAGREPQPGLSRLNRLADEMREAGLPVELTIEGTPSSLASGVDLSAYRIVQEGLTNALKHAGPARARVMIRYLEGRVEIEIDDDGRGHAPGAPGHGLVGMRERVGVYGGEIVAGPKDSGGYRLSAWLPAEPADVPVPVT